MVVDIAESTVVSITASTVVSIMAAKDVVKPTALRD
jgi:hypothetical protein